MQGEIFDLAGKAGRHFLRLVKDYFWVRISLFIVLCLGIIFVGNNGLGQPPQAITVFSEGKPAHNAKNGFQAIKGMNQAVKEGTLTDPFDEVPREPSVRASGKQERPDVKVTSKANEKGKKSMAKPTNISRFGAQFMGKINGRKARGKEGSFSSARLRFQFR